MKLNIKVLMFFVFIMTNNSRALSQGYVSKFVPLDIFINTMNFIYEDGEYIVSSISIINGVTTSTIIRVDEDFNEIKRDSFYSENRSWNANCMTMIGDKIVGSSWDYIECPDESNESCDYMNYKVIDLQGNEINSIDIGRETPYFFSFEVDHTDDGDVICGGNRIDVGANATIFNFDLDGNTNWKYESFER